MTEINHVEEVLSECKFQVVTISLLHYPQLIPQRRRATGCPLQSLVLKYFSSYISIKMMSVTYTLRIVQAFV